MRMKNILFIGILVCIGIGCKQSGDNRKIPAPAAGSQQEKLFKDISGSTYTASSLSCSSPSRSSTVNDVAVKISSQTRRLLDKNKGTFLPVLEIKFDAREWVSAEQVIIDKEPTDPQRQNILKSLKANMRLKESLPGSNEGYDDVFALVNEHLSHETVLNPKRRRGTDMYYKSVSVESEKDTKQNVLGLTAELKGSGDSLKLYALMDTKQKENLQIEFETPKGDVCKGLVVASNLRSVTGSLPPLSSQNPQY